MAEQKELLLKIKADLSQASKEIQRIKKQLSDTGKQSEETGSRINKGFEKASAGVKEFGKSLLSVKGIITGAIIKGTLDLVVAQRRLEMQAKALRSNAAFGGLQKDFENIENATKGMVNQFEIVGAVNKALAFGIDLSGGKLNQLIKAAQKASIAMGTDLKTSVDDMMTAMGRGSVMIADNLGATFKLSEAYDAYAKKIGTVSSALTDNQKKLAFNEMFLEKLEVAYKHIGDDQLYDPIISNAKRIDNAWNDAKKGFTSFIGSVIKKTQDAAIGVAKLNESTEELAATLLLQYEAEAATRSKKFAFIKKYNRELYEQVLTAKTMAESEKLLNAAYRIQLKIQADIAKKAKEKAKAEAAASKARADRQAIVEKEGEAEDKKQAKIDAANNKRQAAIEGINIEIELRKTLGMLDEETEIKLIGKIELLKAVTAEERIQAKLMTERAVGQFQLIESLKKGFAQGAVYIEDQMTETIGGFMNWEGDEKESGEWSIFSPIVSGAENMADSVGASFDDMIQRAGESAEEARSIFTAISSTGLGLIRQMATKSAEAVLLSIGEMAAGFAWSAGSQMVADGIAGNAKAAVIATWPFVGPALAAPMFAASNSAIAGGLGLMAAGGLGTFMTAQAGQSSGGGGSERGAQERNLDAESTVIEEDRRVYLYPSRTAFQKGFVNEGVMMKR